MKFCEKYFRASVIVALAMLALPFPVVHAEQDEQAEDRSSQAELIDKIDSLEQKFALLNSRLIQLSSQISETIRQTQEAINLQRRDDADMSFSVSMDDDPVLGSNKATVAIIEFSDFQCPFCRKFHKTVFPMLKREYIDSGKAKFVFRDNPLDFHPQAEGASVAANCAHEQGAFWDYQDKLWDAQQKLNEESYKSIAESLDLDASNFSTCLQDSRMIAEIKKDHEYGMAFGVEGTPSFFIGKIQGGDIVDSKMIVGAQPFPVFARILDDLLK